MGGEDERARDTLKMVRPGGEQDEAIRAVEAELKLKEAAPAAATDNGETAALRAKVEAAPADHQARYDLALALDAAGDREGAIDQLLELVKRDRKWNEEAARKQLVTIFEALGFTDPRAVEGRRKLSGILFS
jgi:putative thioredoxin